MWHTLNILIVSKVVVDMSNTFAVPSKQWSNCWFAYSSYMVSAQWKTYFTVQFPQVHHNKCVSAHQVHRSLWQLLGGQRWTGMVVSFWELLVFQRSKTHTNLKQQTVHSKVTEKIIWEHQKKERNLDWRASEVGSWRKVALKKALKVIRSRWLAMVGGKKQSCRILLIAVPS